MLDGLIYKQKSESDYIDYNDIFELVVISNPKTVTIPDFMGWNYMDLLRFTNENDINVIIEYVSMLYPSNHVVGQSVEAGEMILKNSNPITIYLAKEN
jgi:beta-lactam-binding protein with PASTA domain